MVGKSSLWKSRLSDIYPCHNRFLNPVKPPRNFKPKPFAYHEEVTLEIDSLNNHGAGVGRVDGWVVMVPFTLPGETIKARIWRNASSYSEADLVAVVHPSTHRVKPKCPLFGECGGCQYQHFEYSLQLAWKQRQVAELLERLAEVEVSVSPTFPSPRQYGYRAKITPHFQKPRGSMGFAIGFQRHGSRKLVDVPQCPIATDAVNAALSEKRDQLRSGVLKYRRGATVLLREVIEGVVSNPKSVVSQRIGDLVFQFLAGEFFQNNPFLLPKLVSHVTEQAQGPDLRCLIDAYCGVGVFCLSAASRFERSVGIELSSAAVKWANANALLNKVDTCKFYVGAAENVFGKTGFAAEATTVIIDPPRKGCGGGFLEKLLAFGPKKVVYVACDPCTQARDIKTFLSQGYQITCVQPFDMFPQTRHIENVVTLVRL